MRLFPPSFTRLARLRLSELALSATAMMVTPVLAASNAEPIWLVTEQEAHAYQGEAGFALPPPLGVRNAQPVIEVIKPELVEGQPLHGPFAIQVKFISLNDSRIRPETFRAYYGALKFDVTSRLMNLTKVTSEGFLVNQADIPKGKHRLLLQVTDERNRLAERDLRLHID